MELVKYALKFRLTFYVIAILTTLLGGAAIVSTPKDVFPNVDIPVVTVIWTYTGLSTTEMAQRVTTYAEYSTSNNVNGIKTMESQTLQGVSVMKIYFQPDVNIELAIAQVVSSMNSIRALMPPGINPPTVIRYTASQAPVLQLALSSKSFSEQQLYDFGLYRVRQALTATPGATLPTPWGGKQRQIMVDLDVAKLQARGLTPLDIVNAVTAQNVTVPSGLVKFGELQYVVRLNSTPEALETLNNIPVRFSDGAPVLLRDLAQVRDGSPPQQNIVRVDGVRSVLLTVLKNGNASTLDVVENVKSAIAKLREAIPPEMRINELFDQSVFVSHAIADVLREGAIAAGLTGLMILLFLGSWRSTLIVIISIPLSILVSLAVLSALGHTINIMTLGGLALAVGILVDDATVAIENTYRLFEEGKEFRHAVAEGASGIAKPALISTLAICAAFVSVLFLTDVARYLFTPQALAVVFAMLASYFFSRTLTPILMDQLLAHEHHGRELEGDARRAGVAGGLARVQLAFEHAFERMRAQYGLLLAAVLRRRAQAFVFIVGVLALGGALFVNVGEDYYPQIDAGQMTLHVRARPGLRIEDTELFFQKVENAIREIVPEHDLALLIDNIGLPQITYNFAFTDGTVVAYFDGQIMMSLHAGHAPTAGYMKKMREILPQRFPEATFYFQASDIVTQILNFGLPSPIALRIVGRDAEGNQIVAQKLLERVKGVKGVVDAHIHQILDAPEFFVDIDRWRALQLGASTQQVASNVNVSLSSSFQVSPNFWTDPKSGIPYQVSVQTPEYRIATLDAFANTPVSAVTNAPTAQVDLLTNLAQWRRGIEQTVVNHSNTQPTYDIYANLQDRDLGAIERDLRKVVAELEGELKPGNMIVLRGQIESKNLAFRRIGLGLIASMAFVYLLMVVNFQSWGDPFVVILALPIAFCGIVFSLYVTGTTFSIPSLMGAIMSVGVASANSILLVTFAREHREETGASAEEAAYLAGMTRIRPVLMTAAAMFVGLLPMSLALGDGSEPNAVLARAVMGGIAFGTCSTLLFVPLLYSILRRGEPRAPRDYL
ncbi:efflux RND transporter permease subunit [Methylosinus sp. Sm6]|uniref:efflux RND transporter permease subunit n=1 Tax=Methylosinus sp. Sm6 TaxID=2866948 RepID=UPI001C997729|nr:efflux RND transporter permease subunit [Methylosinus sp. Sm6]MBY6240785.1 efflux RND transporter permease subunit [Methylosinus sp. Sm6]